MIFRYIALLAAAEERFSLALEGVVVINLKTTMLPLARLTAMAPRLQLPRTAFIARCAT